MSIKGDEIVLDVPHRGLDISYPISIDPEVRVYSGHSTQWAGWRWDQSTPGANWFGALDNCALGCGLYQAIPRNRAVPNASSAYFSYKAPVKATITGATFGGIAHVPYTYAGLPYTRSYGGIANNSAWEPGRFANQDGLQPDTGMAVSVATTVAFWGFTNAFAVSPTATQTATQRAQDENRAYFAMSANHPNGASQIGPTSTYGATSMAWSTILLGDKYKPQWHPETTAPTDSGWTDDNNAWHSRSLRATDEGLGIGAITLTGTSDIQAPADATGPTGVIDGSTVRPDYAGRPSLYPALDWPKDPVKYKLNEGVNTLTPKPRTSQATAYREPCAPGRRRSTARNPRSSSAEAWLDRLKTLASRASTMRLTNSTSLDETVTAQTFKRE